MKLQTVKSRFLGSYALIILLLIIQLPILYYLIIGMSKKYGQVEEAATLKKRAIEISYILNRHILNGEEELEGPFQKMKGEYGAIIEGLRNGTRDVQPITDHDVLKKLDEVKHKWEPMKAALDAAMDSGDTLSRVIVEIETTTYPMVEKMNAIVSDFVKLNDKSYSKSIDLAGLQRMRTVRMAYLMERYSRSNFELDTVAQDLTKTINDFETTFNGLRYGSKELGLKAVNNKGMLDKFNDAENLWKKRKALIGEGMRKKDMFRDKVNELSNMHTPQIITATDELTREIATRARGSAYTGLAILGVTVGISIAIALFFVWLMNHHVIAPIIRVKETVMGFARGDLTKRSRVRIRILGSEVKDEITDLSASVDEMAEQMSRVLGKISDSSNLLASTSEQLSASSIQIEHGANSQSSKTDQVATAMEEMNATVIEVAKNAQQASESARGAQAIATKGGDVVRQVVTAMKDVAESTSITADTIKRLGKSSEEIGTIVSVINDIADQTNLLALNAAIEAARAGEQGRGFAVVADEVRKLAERTTKATKEISDMITAIQGETSRAVGAMSSGTEKVENGVKLANEAGSALSQIVNGVQSVTDIINHMATSTEEQSATTDEISRNMESITEVAKANVNSIGEVGKATTEMARLATELKDMVRRFSVGASLEEKTVERRLRKESDEPPGRVVALANHIREKGAERPAEKGHPPLQNDDDDEFASEL